MVTEARNLGAGGFARLQQSELGRNVDFNAVDENFRHDRNRFRATRMDDLLRRRKWAKSPHKRFFLRKIRSSATHKLHPGRRSRGSDLSYGTCCVFVGTRTRTARWFGMAGERSVLLMANNQPNQPREQQRQAQPGRQPQPDQNRPERDQERIDKQRERDQERPKQPN